MGLFDFLFKKKEPAVWKDPYGASEHATMTPKEDVNYFVNNKVTFEEVLKPGQTAVLNWDYAPGMSKDMIETVVGSCSCTAKITWGAVGVRAVFTHEEKTVPEDGGYYTKTLTVYLKSKHSLVSDGRGGMMYDPAKPRVVLTFTGKLMP